MSTMLSTFFSEQANGEYCEVHYNFADKGGEIVYYNDQGLMFNKEEYNKKSVDYIECIAEDWALGVKN